MTETHAKEHSRKNNTYIREIRKGSIKGLFNSERALSFSEIKKTNTKTRYGSTSM